MSPVELNERAQAASDFMNQADDAQMNYYKQFYTQGDLVAFALDPQRAAPLVGKAFKASQIGGTAADQGVAIERATAEQLASMGVTQNEAQAGFGLVATSQPILDKLGAIYGGGVTQDETIQATFASDAAANKKIKTLASRERAAFNTSSGISASTLSTNRSSD
jgi:hypothetical protein